MLNSNKISKTYVYNNIEIKLTGRKATNHPKMMELVEITPFDEEEEGTWKKWVKKEELFEIQEE